MDRSNSNTPQGGNATPYNIQLPPITLPPIDPPAQLDRYPPLSRNPSNDFYSAAPVNHNPLSPPLSTDGTLSGGKQKKEIKRRTKTGCLTCRQRRIKCDEGKPTCRNCDKSRRECKGYDPLFVSNRPATSIQPAPTAAPGPPPAPPIYIAHTSAEPSPTIPHTLPPISHPYTPPIQNGHTSAPRSQPPTLDNLLNPQKHDSPLDNLPTMANLISAPQDSQLTKFRVVSIEDLFATENVPPPHHVPLPNGASRLTEGMCQEISILYHRDYAQGLDSFFETSWYNFRSREILFADKDTMELFAFMADLMTKTKTEDFKGLAALKSLEAQLTWRLMCLCRSPSANALGTMNGAAGGSLSDLEQITELRVRLDVLEHLITNRYTIGNSLTAITYPPQDKVPNLKKSEINFWHLVGEFTSLDPEKPGARAQIDSCLGAMRGSLGQLENRDILYSIMVARYVGGREAKFPHNYVTAYNNDEADERTKLYVAKKFLEDESLRATTQVKQRVCNMAINSWYLARK